MKSILVRFWRDEDGLETVEWAVVAAVLVGGTVAAFSALGPKIGGRIGNLNNLIT